MSEYALLCFLWWRWLRTLVSAGAAPWIAFTISIAYSATDEFHQHFVAGRHGTPIDVGIDTVGAAIAVYLIRRRAER